MAFPTTGILDDFNRANESPLSNGGNWLTRNTASNLALTSLQVQGLSGTNALGSEYWAVATYGPDCEVYCIVPVLGGSADYLRLWLRLINPGAGTEQGYMMQWAPNDANGCRIFKETARETYTQLAQDAAATYTTNDQIGFEAIGTQLTAYKNGAAVLTIADATYSAAGNLALGMRGSTKRGDDFGGGTVVASTPASAFWLTTL